MTKQIVRMLRIWTATSILFSGCHFFEEADDIDECPLNSGYPCPCTYADDDVAALGLCRDGSSCIYFYGNDSRGICSLPCSGTTDVQSCVGTDGYGNEGLCGFYVNESETPNYCALICEGSGNGNCSPGMECTPVSYETYSMCLPEQSE